jgi:hypothetical protein
MHLRLTMLTADPQRLDEGLTFIQEEARPLVEGEPGNLGLSLKADKELGVALVESFWVSADAMRESDRNVRSTREQASHRIDGTVTVESYQVASVTRTAPWNAGAGVRLTRADADAARLDQVVAAHEDTAVPWLTETEGFCGALLLAHGRTGHLLEETMWVDGEALAGSRSVAAAIRVDAVKATDEVVRALAEYTLIFNSARPA